MFPVYDIIVVGAGHAGCEAAAAAANMGSKVLLVTMNMNTIGQMSCNPAMGGVAKGQIVREIDALGGLSGIVTDTSAIQFRMLNLSKGPAMWSPRAQNDRQLFSATWRSQLESIKNIDFWQESVIGLIIKEKRAIGIRTSLGLEIKSKAVILTNGTFLNGKIHIGEKSFGGGRAAEQNSLGITEVLRKLGFESGRMKTGTPPRVDSRSLDYSKMEEQPGDRNPQKFSFSNTKKLDQQISCWITYTSKAVHNELERGFDKSPMFQGRIKGLGPRYCPSIEDKINRFSERDRHQIFVEPEGKNTIEIYVNGFSTSLPEEVQFKALQKIPGFENVKMFRPGYAIEYDYFPPNQLKTSLETQLIENLYFAGQINGTTGYEEAACQGLIAGINAHNKLNERKDLILKRSQAYIGVLIDDLVTKGTNEPYRMFTSRAEYRIMLRQDNADLRLTRIGYEIGLAHYQRLETLNQKINQIEALTETAKRLKLSPEEINDTLSNIGSNPIREPQTLYNILKRPELNIDILEANSQRLKKELLVFEHEEKQQLEINVKYETYIKKEEQMAQKIQSLDQYVLKDDFNYDRVLGLSHESREKLKMIKPKTIGQATRISGVSPSDISILSVYLGQ